MTATIRVGNRILEIPDEFFDDFGSIKDEFTMRDLLIANIAGGRMEWVH